MQNHLFVYHSTESYCISLKNEKIQKSPNALAHVRVIIRMTWDKKDINTSRAPKARAKKNLCFREAISQKSPEKYVKIEKSPNTLAHERVIIGVTVDKNDISESRAPKARAKKNLGFGDAI